MTKLLDQAFAKARALSEQEQDELAGTILANIDFMVEPLDDVTRAAIQEGIDQVNRGEFASDEEVEALLKRHGA